jgi:tRNA threonylcarbamoyladenosine biosynthesis protein TsaB
MGRAVLRLALTSSTSVVGVAVGSAEETLAFQQVNTERRHAEEITVLVQNVVAESGVKITNLEALVLDVGPGRFTGLRVGIATALGLAIGLDLSVVQLSSLEILAAEYHQSDQAVVAVIDARRDEVFLQRFEPNGSSYEVVVGKPNELGSFCNGAVIVGDGADRYQEIFGEAVQVGAAPSASVMLRMAEGRKVCDAGQIEPLYLRDPDAVPNIKTRQS